MIIKMKENATVSQIEHVKNIIKNRNCTLEEIKDNAITLIINDSNEFLEKDYFEKLDGVKEVCYAKKTFYLASREYKKEDTIIKVKNVLFGEGHFVVIAGPCSIESPEQMNDITKEVKKYGASVLRGGAYKPRTSPYSFQGLGENGLRMLISAGIENDMPVISEITSETMIDEYKDVDIIQVGARNMQNFSLLKALSKIDKPILLKRGLSATIEEWLLSAEYILSGGNPNVILCERGIRTFEPYTRNTLDLSSVLVVKQLSHLPVIVDPSHSAGHWQMVEGLSLAAASVGADGLMIEVHNNPSLALSDGNQSLKIDRFKDTMDKIKKITNILGKELS